jgi:hypothetical protein
MVFPRKTKTSLQTPSYSQKITQTKNQEFGCWAILEYQNSLPLVMAIVDGWIRQ